MDSEKNLEIAVVKSLKDSDLGAVAAEYAEQGLDAVLSEGVLRDIPIVNTVVAVGKLGLSINDAVFTRKLVRFLAELRELSDQERQTMVEKLDQEEGFRQRVGERIIEILDRVDSHAKPEMVARVFRAYARGEIEYSTLVELTHAIETLPQYQMRWVEPFLATAADENPAELPAQTYTALAMAGLAVAASGYGALVYQPSEVCESFVAVVLANNAQQADGADT